ncbi:MAG: hypothetical protein ACI35P_02955 [Bacillus sp. (in: firmicutes)]
MNKTKKILLILLVVFILIMLGVGILIVSFFQGMKADSEEEKKAIALAEPYLQQHFQAETTIVDVLYDNMGNWGYFDYAAKVRHEQDGTEFLVYHNQETNQMEDTYIASKWEDDAEKDIQPYVEQQLGTSITGREIRKFADRNDWDEIQEKMEGKIEVGVYFDEDEVKQLQIDPNFPGNYTNYDVAPTIRITIPRSKLETDEGQFHELISLFQEKVVAHGTLVVHYSDMGVPLEEDEWSKSF